MLERYLLSNEMYSITLADQELRRQQKYCSETARYKFNNNSSWILFGLSSI